ncbi:3-deoxy-8-phosphooctulonate synthase, partial [bacterium]
MSSYSVGDVTVGDGRLTVIAGPCLAESQGLCEEVAGTMKELCTELGFPYVFKASFDKANRTSVDTVRGGGMEEGLAVIQSVGQKFGLPTTTDLHLPDQAATVAQAVDLLQIPAFLCRQTDLLEAAAKTGKPVNVKKGQFLAPHDCGNIVEKLRRFDASGIMLTERGTTFGYN